MDTPERTTEAAPAVQTARGRSPLIAGVGLCAAIVGVALFAAFMMGSAGEGVWAPRVFWASIPIAALGGCLSLIGYLQARREGLRRGIALAGMIVGLGLFASVAGLILLFFITTVIWGG